MSSLTDLPTGKVHSSRFGGERNTKACIDRKPRHHLLVSFVSPVSPLNLHSLPSVREKEDRNVQSNWLIISVFMACILSSSGHTTA